MERSVHPFHFLIRDFDPKLVFDLVKQFSQVKVRDGIAKIVIWSHTLPAIAELFNADFADSDRDVVGDATAAADLGRGAGTAVQGAAAAIADRAAVVAQRCTRGGVAGLAGQLAI